MSLRIVVHEAERSALRWGRRKLRRYYGERILQAGRASWHARRDLGAMVKSLAQATMWSPGAVMRATVHFLRVRLRKVLPPAVERRIQRLRGRQDLLPLGSVRFGDLRRLSPISRIFGFDRGTPVDRYYIERFLGEHRRHRRTRARDRRQHLYPALRRHSSEAERLLDISPTNPRSTLVGDLERSDILPEGAFDCIVLTQTLQFCLTSEKGSRRCTEHSNPAGFCC